MRYTSKEHEATTRAMQNLETFDNYGQASCRYMCQKILISLPPELCDMIIERVIGHDHVGVVATGTCELIYAHTWRHQVAHYWKVEYVGKVMLARMMAVWYRMNSFIIQWNLLDKRRFLNEDAPCVYTPRYKLISKICITVSPDFLAFDPKKDPKKELHGFYRMYPRRNWEQEIRDLELLFQLRSGASIHIFLDYMNPQAVLKDGQNALLLGGTAPMIESLCRLRKAGYVIGASVVFQGKYHGLVDTFGYRLEEMHALGLERTDCMPVNDSGMVWQ